jgi:hypothetical protein
MTYGIVDGEIAYFRKTIFREREKERMGLDVFGVYVRYHRFPI